MARLFTETCIPSEWPVSLVDLLQECRGCFGTPRNTQCEASPRSLHHRCPKLAARVCVVRAPRTQRNLTVLVTDCQRRSRRERKISKREAEIQGTRGCYVVMPAKRIRSRSVERARSDQGKTDQLRHCETLRCSVLGFPCRQVPAVDRLELEYRVVPDGLPVTVDAGRRIRREQPADQNRSQKPGTQDDRLHRELPPSPRTCVSFITFSP